MFCRFLEQDHIDWRKLVYRMSLRFLRRTNARTDSKGALQCLIIDDTDFPKTDFKTEMTGCIYSHVLHRSILGFKGLFLCHIDGKTQSMLDFSLHGKESKKECHLIGMIKMGKTRYRTEARNLNAPAIIDRLKKR